MRKAVVAGACATVLVAAGISAAAMRSASPSPHRQAQAAHAVPIQSFPAPTLLVDARGIADGGTVGTIDWAAPMRVTAVGGTVSSAAVTGPDGLLAGHSSDGAWVSDASLLPEAVYTIKADLTGPGGHTSTADAVATTQPAAEILHATIGIGDGDVVGVGEPVIITFNHSVPTEAARRQLTDRLSVEATPPVVGAWHWVNDAEVHYRPATFWAAGTRLHVGVDLARLNLTGTRTWGSGTHTSDYSVGDALVSTVDVTAHTMAVRRNGVLLRTLPVSTGRDKYPTKGGVHIVLEKQADQLFDSRTVGIPTASPDGYFEHLPWSVRISNGGAFVHANPGTVQYQGVTNVSHGCVNLSVADAEWYFNLARRGDIVNVIHAAVPPMLSDPGMSDWNVSFDRWQATAFDL